MRVVDASVVLKWFVLENGSDAAAQLALEPLAAPALILSETANGLWKKRRGGEILGENALIAMARLPRLLTQIVPMDRLAERALKLAIELDHPAYDCVYLALAEDLSTQLVTADKRMVNKLATTPYATRLIALS